MKYPIEKKYNYKAGTAVFNSSNCISFTEGKYCSECVRVCPTDAIAITKGWEPNQEAKAEDAPSADGAAPDGFVGPVQPATGQGQEMTTHRPAGAGEYDPALPAKKQIAPAAADVPAPDGMTPTRPVRVVYDKCVGCGACEFACNQIVYGDTAMVLTSAGRATATSLERK
jgi:ferredoxin